MDKNKVVVTVHGREYTLVGAEPVDYMQRVAGYVDRRMSEISYASYLPEDRLMALTALNLADELLKSKDEVTAMRREMTQMRQALAKAEWAAHTAGRTQSPKSRNKPDKILKETTGAVLPPSLFGSGPEKAGLYFP